MEGLTTNFWDFHPQKNGCRGTGVTLDQIIMQHLPEPIEGGRVFLRVEKWMIPIPFHAFFRVYASIFEKKTGNINPLKIGDFIFSSFQIKS